jgi:protein TonB
MSHPRSEAPKPVEQPEDPIPPVKSAQEPISEPVERQAVEVAKIEPETPAASKEPEPVRSAEPVMAPRQPAISPPEAADARPVETPANPTPSESLLSSAPPGPAPSSSHTPVQTANSKVDHRWLAESLWRRVAELKRYPSSARLNGQEGKVILKATIRADGQLADVSVQKSSGHTVLDAAAIEAVKLAFPLQMKQPINRPEIVVSLPIVYSLAN